MERDYSEVGADTVRLLKLNGYGDYFSGDPPVFESPQMVMTADMNLVNVLESCCEILVPIPNSRHLGFVKLLRLLDDKFRETLPGAQGEEEEEEVYDSFLRFDGEAYYLTTFLTLDKPTYTASTVQVTDATGVTKLVKPREAADIPKFPQPPITISFTFSLRLETSSFGYARSQILIEKLSVTEPLRKDLSNSDKIAKLTTELENQRQTVTSIMASVSDIRRELLALQATQGSGDQPHLVK